MEDLFQMAIQNVKSYEDQNKKRIADAIDHYMKILTKNSQKLIETASANGKTQVLIYRINFRKRGEYKRFTNFKQDRYYNSQKRYYYNNLKITDLYENYGLRERLEEFFSPFKVIMVNTSVNNWCIFVYWRDIFKEYSDTSDSEFSDSEQSDESNSSCETGNSYLNATITIQSETARCLQEEIIKKRN